MTSYDINSLTLCINNILFCGRLIEYIIKMLNIGSFGSMQKIYSVFVMFVSIMFALIIHI